MSDSHQSPRDLYDATASRWVRRQPTSLSDFTGRPPVLQMCQPVAGLRILDLGCGEGYCSRQLCRMGAGDVTGIDLSQNMIDAARAEEAHEPMGITYVQGDGTDLSAFPSGEFDLVLSMFMFNYLTVEQMGRSTAEVARLLRPGGRFVFSVPHPVFPFLHSSGPPFYFDTGDKGYFTGRDVRFAGQIWKRDQTQLQVQACHKVIEDYFDALRAAGFDRMPLVRELRVTPEMIALDKAFFAPLWDVPVHLALSVIR